MKKRIGALVLSLVMILSLISCADQNQNKTLVSGDPLTKEDVIQLVTVSHASWPFREDWKVWEYIEEGTGATLQVNAYPASDASTKYSLMLASPDTLPNIMAFTSTPGDKYISQGAFVAFDDMAEYMPNYNAWLDTLSDEEYKNNVAFRKSYDGKTYYSPVIGREMAQDVRAWLYREDIFEKHNLKIPETFEELYEVCKKLKELYPDSYPLCLRSGFTPLNTTGSSWKPYWETTYYYDYNEEKWCYGAVDDIMLDILTFYKKMIDEELVTTNFLTIPTISWQELVTTDRGFILPDFQVRIDFFNGMAREKNPDFTIQAMVPPVANTDTGATMVNKYNVDPVGMMMCNTGDEGRVANSAKFMDWFYSDTAVELVSWGKEGETFEATDGKKHYITNAAGEQATSLYGFSTYGTFTRMDTTATEATQSDDIIKTRDMVFEHMMPYANPLYNVSFNDEEQKVRDLYYSAIDSYTNEMLSKFLLGQEPLSKFDEFRQTIKEMGLDEVLKVYEIAYKRMK